MCLVGEGVVWGGWVGGGLRPRAIATGVFIVVSHAVVVELFLLS